MDRFLDFYEQVYQPATEGFADHFRKTKVVDPNHPKKYVDPNSIKYPSIEAMCTDIDADGAYKEYHGLVRGFAIIIKANTSPSSNQIKAMNTVFKSIDTVLYKLINVLNKSDMFPDQKYPTSKKDLTFISIFFRTDPEDRILAEMTFDSEGADHFVSVSKCFDPNTGKFNGDLSDFNVNG